MAGTACGAETIRRVGAVLLLGWTMAGTGAGAAGAGTTRERAELRTRIARLVFSSPAVKAGAPSIADQYADLSRRIDLQERALAELVPDFAVRAFLAVTPDDVQAALPAGGALVDILENKGQVHAWIVPREGDVSHADLGPAAEIAPLANAFNSARY